VREKDLFSASQAIKRHGASESMPFLFSHCRSRAGINRSKSHDRQPSAGIGNRMKNLE
jgi:hypothetical protein